MREVVETNLSLYLEVELIFRATFRCGNVARSQTAGKSKKQERERGEGTILHFHSLPHPGPPCFSCSRRFVPSPQSERLE